LAKAALSNTGSKLNNYREKYSKNQIQQRQRPGYLLELMEDRRTRLVQVTLNEPVNLGWNL